MLSVHAVYYRCSEQMKVWAREAGATAQVAGGVPEKSASTVLASAGLRCLSPIPHSGEDRERGTRAVPPVAAPHPGPLPARERGLVYAGRSGRYRRHTRALRHCGGRGGHLVSLSEPTALKTAEHASLQTAYEAFQERMGGLDACRLGGPASQGTSSSNELGGTWRMNSPTLEEDGRETRPYGLHPPGVLVFTPDNPLKTSVRSAMFVRRVGAVSAWSARDIPNRTTGPPSIYGARRGPKRSRLQPD